MPFTPAENWQNEWRGPEQLQRSGERYKQCVAHLEGTREVHALALVRTAHLTEGILHPPDLPEMQKSSDAQEQEQEQELSRSLKASKQAKPPVWVPRYVLGNWDESGPTNRASWGICTPCGYCSCTDTPSILSGRCSGPRPSGSTDLLPS